MVHFTLNSTLYRCEKVLLQTIALYTVIITILRYLFYKREKDLLDKRKFDRIFGSSEEKYTNLYGPPCYLSFFFCWRLFPFLRKKILGLHFMLHPNKKNNRMTRCHNKITMFIPDNGLS